MLKFMFPQKPKIKGIIGYLGLESFWVSCTAEEQNALIKYYQGGLGASSDSSPIIGEITYSSNTKLKYFSSMIGWAVSDKNYILADKIITAGDELNIDDSELIDAHFFWQTAADCYYKQRNVRPDAIDITIKFCKKDIAAFPKYIKQLEKELGCIPYISTFQRLAIIYENNHQYQDAIQICKLAIKYGLTDSTKGGYSSRLEKLEKKMNK